MSRRRPVCFNCVRPATAGRRAVSFNRPGMSMPEIRAAIVPVTPFQQNCAILWDEPSMRAVVVDPGGDVDRILDATRKLGVQPEAIWLTHGHIDHAGGAAALRDALQTGDATIPIVGPAEQDRFLLQGLEQQGRTYGIAGARNVLPDRWLTEGEELRLADHVFQVLHCPGHTPGHITLINMPPASPSSATSSSAARSAGPTSPTATTRR